MSNQTSRCGATEVPPPTIGVDSMREAYGHVARQQCLCGANFLVEGEHVHAGGRYYALCATCLNPDCGKRIEFRFTLSARVASGGLGRAMVESVRPANPGHMFPGVGVGVQSAIGLISVWLAARATGVDAAVLDGIVEDAARHAGVAGLGDSLDRLGREFDSIAAALERGLACHAAPS